MFKDILLAVDLGDPESQEKAVSTAIEQAKTFGARLHVITVVPDFGMSIVGGFFPKEHEQEAIDAANEALHAYVAEKKASMPDAFT